MKLLGLHVFKQANIFHVVYDILHHIKETRIRLDYQLRRSSNRIFFQRKSLAGKSNFEYLKYFRVKI